MERCRLRFTSFLTWFEAFTRKDTVEMQCKALAAFLAANPNVQFVILETLDDFLKLSDIKENTASRLSFETFEKLVMGNFAQQASFLFLHQMKKEVTEDSGDGLLGASGIRAKLDAQIYIKDGGDNDARRVIHTRRRRSGVAIVDCQIWSAAADRPVVSGVEPSVDAALDEAFMVSMRR